MESVSFSISASVSEILRQLVTMSRKRWADFLAAAPSPLLLASQNVTTSFAGSKYFSTGGCVHSSFSLSNAVAQLAAMQTPHLSLEGGAVAHPLHRG